MNAATAAGNDREMRPVKLRPNLYEFSFRALRAHSVGQPSPQGLGMPTTLPEKKSRQTPDDSVERELVAASVFVALVFSVLTAVLPAQTVLPMAGLVVILSGVTLGAWTLRMRRMQGAADERLIDVSGVLVLFGFAAAMMSDKAEALRLLAGLPSQ